MACWRVFQPGKVKFSIRTAGAGSVRKCLRPQAFAWGCGADVDDSASISSAKWGLTRQNADNETHVLSGGGVAQFWIREDAALHVINVQSLSFDDVAWYCLDFCRRAASGRSSDRS